MTLQPQPSRFVLLMLAAAITAGALVLTAPGKTVELNSLGEAAINTAPAIRIKLAAEPGPEPEVTREPSPQPEAKPEPEPEPEPEMVAEVPEPESTPIEPERTQTGAAAESSTSQPAESEVEEAESRATIPLQNAGERSEVDHYLSRLRRHLARFYDYPRRARRLGQEGTPVIVFEFRRDGSLVAHSLQTGSGHSLLDDSALAMLEQAAPLPAVPREISGNRFRYALPVRFSLR